MKDSLIPGDEWRQPRGLDRRGFLRHAGAVAAGGLGGAALLERRGGASAAMSQTDATLMAPGPAPASARPSEPYFFRIEPMRRDPLVGQAAKEV